MSEGASRYRITRLIQRGGMAEVFEASIVGEGGFSRRVALKRLLPEHLGDEGFVRTFVAEARLVSQLQHANVVGVYDFGTMDDVPFQVLEYVDGLDLVRLEAHAAAQGDLPPAELWLAVVAEASHGLDYAHHARDGLGRPLGIVHRDVTPSNVLVAWAGGVKLGDFAIAHSLEPRDGREPTRVGSIKGKLAYLSPEQLAGEPVDARSDVFAMGCVLHRMLVGASPLETDEARRKVQAGGRPVIDPRVPADVARVLAKALEPDRAKRLATAGQLAAECARAVTARTTSDARSVVRTWMDRLRPPADRLAVSPLGALLDVELVLSDFADDAYRRFASTVKRIPDFETNRELPARPDAGRAPSRPSASPPPARLPTAQARPARASGASGSSAPPDAMVGTVVGEYQLLELIGKGGFARVYRARHLVFGKEFALKILLENFKDSPGAQRRFQREALALHAVSHPNLVGIEDSGVTEDGRPYIVMELAEGVTLREALISNGGPFDLHRVRRLGRQIAAALAEAHRQGLVHRDLKPKNVVLTHTPAGEEAKVLDFGLALLLDPRSELTRLTSAGHYLGTARWMAPEQVVNAAEVGPPADLYCLGLILYAMATGQPPFKGTADEVMRKHREEVPHIPAAMGPFAPLVARLLEKDPTRRPASAQAVVDALDRLELGPPPLVDAQEPTRLETVATEAVLPTAMVPEPGTVPLKALTPMSARPPIGGREPSDRPSMLPSAMPRGMFAALAVLALLTAGVMGAVIALVVRGREVPVVAAPPPLPSPTTEPEPAPPVAVAAEPAAVAAEPAAVAAEPAARPAASGPSDAPAEARPSEARATEAPRRSESDALRAAFEQRINTELAKRALTRADLELSPAARAARTAWTAARDARDPRAVERAGAALVAAVQAFEVDREALRARLEGVRDSLAKAAAGRTAAEVAPLERRYLTARSDLSSSKDAIQIARSIRELEREIAALARP